VELFHGFGQRLEFWICLFVGDSGFLAIIITHDELQFDVHKGASPGLGGGGMM
jgi:hypothetical protein